MTGRGKFDEHLARTLPLPLAQLYRRAHNANSPLERHLAAYYLWEAALKLLGSVAIIQYARRTRQPDTVAESLKNLARPSTGHWREFVRELVPLLADEGDAAFGSIHAGLSRKRQDMPRAAGLDFVLVKSFDAEAHRPASARVNLGRLFDRLVHHRNKRIGKRDPSSFPPEFHEKMADALLGGVTDMLRKMDFLAGRRMVYVSEVSGRESGEFAVQRLELSGQEPIRLPIWRVRERSTERLPLPGRIYLVLGTDRDGEPDLDALEPMYPLAVFDSERGEVLLLNCRQGKQKAQYIAYGSGNDRVEIVAADHTELLGRVLGMPVEVADVDAWAADSLAEDPPVPEPPQEQPRQVGEFELLSEIGRGGMGMVYRARQPSLGRQVAVKRLLAVGDERAQARFSREIRALGQVDHPHLVKIYGSGADGEEYFYAMELIEGADLGDVCAHLADSSAGDVGEQQWQAAVSTACQQARTKGIPLSDFEDPWADGQIVSEQGVQGSTNQHEFGADADASHQPAPRRASSGSHVRQVVGLVRQVALAAHALHQKEIIHRDIKPANIMVTPRGDHAVLMDLGLAQLADQMEGRITRTRQFVGTLRYASPEQVLAAGDRLDARSDVYSLGSTLWELLTLRPLFGATDATPTPKLMRMIQHTDPESPRRLNAHVSRDLDAIVRKCLEKRETRRYHSAAAMAEDLQCWLDGKPVTAQPPTLRYKLGKFVCRNWRPLTTAACFLIIAICGTILAFVRIDTTQEELDKARFEIQRLESIRVKLQAEIDRRKLEVNRTQSPRVTDGAMMLYEGPGLRNGAEELDKVVQRIKNRFGDKELPELEDVRVRLARATLSNANRDYQHTLQLFPEREQLPPNAPVIEIQVVRGDAFYGLREWRKALKCYERVRELRPNRWEIRTAEANCQRYLGRLDMAIGYYDEIVGYFERDVPDGAEDDWRKNLARALSNRGTALGGMGKWRDSLDDYDKAVGILRDLLEADESSEIDPIQTPSLRDFARTLTNRGVARGNQGMWSEALEDCKAAVEFFERLVAAGRIEFEGELAEACANRVTAFGYTGRWREAFEDGGQAVSVHRRLVERGRREFNPGLAASLVSRGTAARNVGDWRAAADDFREAVEILTTLVESEDRRELEKDWAKALTSYANALANLGSPARAKDHSQQAVEILGRLVETPNGIGLRNDYASVLANHGLALGKLSDWESAARFFGEAVKVRRELVDGGRKDLTNDLATDLAGMGDAVSYAGRWKEAYSLFDEAASLLETEIRGGRSELRNEMAKVLSRRGVALGCANQWKEAYEDCAAAVEIHKCLVEVEDHDELKNDLAKSLINCAIAARHLGNWQESLEHCGAAVTLRTDLSIERPDAGYEADLAIALMNRGTAYGGLRRWEQACADHEKAVAILEREGRPPFDHAEALANLGLVLGKGGDWKAAEGALEEAIKIRRELVQSGREDLTNNLATDLTLRGVAASYTGRWEDAYSFFDEAVSLLETLVREGRAELRNDLAKAQSMRGIALGRGDRWKEAYEDCIAAVKIHKGLVEPPEEHPELKNDLAESLVNCAIASRYLGRWPESLQHCTAAVKLRTNLVNEKPKDGFEADLAIALMNRGAAYGGLRQWEQACMDHEAAVAILERETTLENEYAKALTHRGIALAHNGRLQEASRDCDSSVRIRRDLVKKRHRELENDLAEALDGRAIAYGCQRDWETAFADCSEAVEIRTRLVEREEHAELTHDLARALTTRGHVNRRRGMFVEAIQDYDKAIAIRKKLVAEQGRTELLAVLAETEAARESALREQAQAQEAQPSDAPEG